MRGELKRKHNNKLALRWKGPVQVTKVLSEFLFEVINIRLGSRSTVHGTRINCFRNREFQVTDVVWEYMEFQAGAYCDVDDVEDTGFRDGEVERKVM